MASGQKPTPKAVRAHLEQLLQSVEFRASDKQRKFLRFVVEETLDDRAFQLKGYTIAVAVYGRNELFDPQVDPIVRVEAGRLRRALEHYYLTTGKNDRVRINIPKGGYVPTFDSVHLQPPEAEMLIPDPADNRFTAKPSIAVLPLQNLTGDDDQDYVTDGITEELTAELARYQDFKVIASQSSMRLKGLKVDPKEAGRTLGVRFLLTGGLQIDSETVKVSIRLIDTSTAEQIWGASDKRELSATALIALQEEIAHRIVGVIADQYGLISRRLSRESRKKAPANLSAYDAVLRFYHYETELTPAAFEKALARLEQAVENDPEYALGWAMLAHLHADNHALGFCQIEAPLEKALVFAQKGVVLEPENQFVWDALTLVYFHQGDADNFLTHAEQTIALNPNAPYVIGVSGWHMILYGLWERGLTLLKKGMKLNPLYPTWFHLALYMISYHRGLYENALKEATQFNHPQLYWDPLMRAAALGQMGKKDAARPAVDQLIDLQPDFITKGRLLISHYVKVVPLIDSLVEGLQKAGLMDIK